MPVAFERAILGETVSGEPSVRIDLSACFKGELVFALLSRDAVELPTTVPSGWSLLGHNAFGPLYYKVLTSADLTRHKWSYAAFSSARTVAFAYSGQAESWLAAHSKGTLLASVGRTINLGSVTTTAPFIAVFSACSSVVARSFNFSSEGLIERYDAGSVASYFWQYAGDKNHVAGTFSPSTTTLFVVEGDAYYRLGFIVAINAAPIKAAPRFLSTKFLR